MRRPCIYILRCADGKYYTGMTTDIDHRLEQHSRGGITSFTAKRLPVSLVYRQEFLSVKEAYAAEHVVRGWARCKKEALIRNDFEAIKRFSECRNASHWRRSRR